MIFTGTFNTYDNNQTYNITIGSTGVTRQIVDPLDESLDDIAASGLVVMFDPDPVTISCDRQDLSKRIIISQATINLLSNQDLTDSLFATSNRSIPVSITLQGNNVFFGYVDPLQFNQGYAHNWESITITATDPLGALEDIKVNQLIGITAKTLITPWNLITTILDKVGVNSINSENINATVMGAMQGTNINMKVFFGSNDDDLFSCYDILENVCRYFNLYIGMTDADTALVTCTINNAPYGNQISNFKQLASDDSTSLSTDDVYSQVALTCKIEPIEDLIISFDDKDFLYSDYDNAEKYMTEYVSPGEGSDAWNGFYTMINSGASSWNEAYTKDHYMYVFRNDLWDFGSGVDKNYVEYLGGSIDYTTGETTQMTADQRSLLPWLTTPCRAALVGFASGNEIPANNLNYGSPKKSSLSMDKCLIISTMGHYDNSQTTLDAYESILNASKPICKYRGIDASILTPPDEKTINFIVISGSILLNPLQRLTGPNWSTDTAKLTNYWDVCKDEFKVTVDAWQKGGMNLKYHTVPNPKNGDGAYYNQFWYYGSNYAGSGTNGVYGFLDNDENKMLKYEYSKGGQYDQISKMPVLCCQLSVTHTEKREDPQTHEEIEVEVKTYCVERLDLGENGSNVFEWITEEDLENDPEYQNIGPFFTIGIDPNQDDYIIGQKHQISNSIDFSMNLDKTGTAIPIKSTDHLNGTIEFSILGPYNAVWDEYSKFYFKSFSEGVVQSVRSKSVLGNCQSIMLSNLKIEMTSNNGGINRAKTSEDKDLVYVSNMNPAYIENLEEDINICTPLTTEQAQAMGIKIQQSNSYIYNTDSTPFYGFTSGNEKVKPEYCYVDYMYKEYNRPARIFETQLKSAAFYNGMYGNSMNYEMLNSYFTGLPIGESRLMSYNSSLKYKTLDVKFRQHKTIINEQI